MLTVVCKNRNDPWDMPGGSALELVVCRYDEDVAWSDRWAAHRTLYNKGDDDDLGGRPSERLENVGREGDAYLRHIIRRYPDGLADVTVFCQGRVDDHCDAAAFAAALDGFVDGRLTLTVDGYAGLSRLWGGVKRYEDARHQGAELPLREACEAAGVEPPDGGTWRCNYNGMFAASRERILAHPVQAYERLLSMLLAHDPLGGFAVERMWTLLFDRRHSFIKRSRS